VRSNAPIQIGGTTVVIPETEIDVQEVDASFTILRGDV
jgi:flagellar P-ring protein precursor FlgI